MAFILPIGNKNYTRKYTFHTYIHVLVQHVLMRIKASKLALCYPSATASPNLPPTEKPAIQTNNENMWSRSLNHIHMNEACLNSGNQPVFTFSQTCSW